MNRTVIFATCLIVVAHSSISDAGMLFQESFDTYAGGLNDLTSPSGEWNYIDIKGAGDHSSIGVRPSNYTGTGGPFDETRTGTGKFLVGGRSAIFNHLVSDSMILGAEYTFTVWSAGVGSSFAIFRGYFSDGIPTTATTEANTDTEGNRIGGFLAATGNTSLSSPNGNYTWTERSVTYTATALDVGNPLYINLQSDRNVSTGIIGWDDVLVTTSVPEPSSLMLLGLFCISLLLVKLFHPSVKQLLSNK